MTVLGLLRHRPRKRVIQSRFQRFTGENSARLDAPPSRSMTAHLSRTVDQKGRRYNSVVSAL